MNTPTDAPIAHLPTDTVQARILIIRGRKVLLDSDLARFYGVPTGHLNRAVLRNIERFPADFMFQLGPEESEALIHLGRHGGRRHAPRVFTEHGVSMLSAVLKGPIAVRISIVIMRAFAKLREILATHEELRRKIQEHDAKFDAVFHALDDISTLLSSPTIRLPDPDRKIGFRSEDSLEPSK